MVTADDPRRLEVWLRRHALPLWASAGIDPATGASYERLGPGGTPDRNAAIRMLVQARQMFSYALAHQLGWFPAGAEVAGGIVSFVERLAPSPGAEGGFPHRLDLGFQVVDRRESLYDQAFFILAFARCYQAFGWSAALARAEGLVRHLDRTFAADHGGWGEWRDGGDGDAPGGLGGLRRQNPHMHLFEAFLALYDATSERHWLDRAEQLRRLFYTRWFDHGRGVVLEHFHDDWTPWDEAEGQTVEPGHMMEWAWLLHGHAERCGRPVPAAAYRLYDRALDIGLCPETGLLFGAVTPDGGVIDASHRCWPMTEYVKASVAAARAGRPGAEARAAAAVDKLFECFLCIPTPGAWVDRRSAGGAITVDVAPASTLYHLMLAASEASSLAGCRR